MQFGPFVAQSPSGRFNIGSLEQALRFVRTAGSRAIPHWRIAERMLEVAWMSADDHAAAEFAFRSALIIDEMLVE